MNNFSIALKISNFEFDVNHLNNLMKIDPTEFHYKGESYALKGPTGPVLKNYKDNYWEFRREYESDDWVQKYVDTFIKEIIAPRIEMLKNISTQAALELFIGVNYLGDVNPGFHFQANDLTVLAYAGLDIDMDLYFLKE